MEQKKIVLMGKTGDGKSSAGNKILGEEVFTPKAGASSATSKSVSGHGEVNGRKITVIDTPGFFDTDHEDIETKSKIIKAVVECAPEIHAFVLVLKVGRYTKHEDEVIETFLSLMKEEDVLKHTVVLFTFGDQLQGQTLEGFVASNLKLQKFIEKCEGRCHVIDNKYWNDRDSGEMSNRVQVNNLLDTIDEMVQKNGCFTSEMLQIVYTKIQEEMKKNKENLPPEENEEISKENVHKKILQQVVGVATGAVIGAFLCVSVAFALGVKTLQALKDLLTAAAALFTGKARGGSSEDGWVRTGSVITSIILSIAGFVGAVAKAADEADSEYETMIMDLKANYKNAIAVIEKVEQLKTVF